MSFTSKRDGLDWPLIGIILLIILAVAFYIAAAWWLIWSIVDLASGNAPSVFNVTGTVVGGATLLHAVFGRS